VCFCLVYLYVPSGKLTYGKSPFLIGKLTTNGNFQQQTASLPEGICYSVMFEVHEPTAPC
jgi:hypothetical protein